MKSPTATEAPYPPPARLIRIRITGREAQHDLHALCESLRKVPTVQQHALITPAGRPADGRMTGSTSEVIQLAADIGLQTASLVVAIMSWRLATRSTSTVVVESDDHAPVPIPDGEPDSAVVEPVVRDIDSPEFRDSSPEFRDSSPE